MEQDLTKGNLWKQILVFSFPLMISNVLQVLFNMADVAVVGRFAGSIALGAVGLYNNACYFIYRSSDRNGRWRECTIGSQIL